MPREPEEIKYRGRRRWNGNHGKVWWDGELIFEIEKFEAKVTANREDVISGDNVDSKIVGLKGEGSITIKSVVNRNLNKYLEEWKEGHDPRATIVGLLDDPDMIDSKKERVSIGNVWFNEILLMNFEKGKVVEKEYPFAFTPGDVEYIESVE